jgi:hypothetical protein
MLKLRGLMLLLCGAIILSGCGVRQEKPSSSREPIVPYLA